MNVIAHALFTVARSEFESFVQTAFGFEFDFLLASRQPAGCIIEYRATGLDKAPDSVREKAARLLSGKRVNDPATILNVLVDRGIIPPGTYRIDTKDKPIVPAKRWSRGQLKITGMAV